MAEVLGKQELQKEKIFRYMQQKTNTRCIQLIKGY